MSETLSISRFSPCAGIYVDRAEMSFAITGRMVAFGPEANDTRAGQIQHSINTIWTARFPDSYSVTCNISIYYCGLNPISAQAAEIEILRMDGPSYVSRSSKRMVLNANSRDIYTWVSAHEFGHVLGMDDRYSESIMSRIRGGWGGARVTTPSPGYENNIMAVHNGTLDGRNIINIAIENQPVLFNFSDDDSVVDWVNAHPLSDITNLSTSTKIRSISLLMSGWISDTDLTAINRICGGVISQSEANKIRAAINVLDCTDIGQRTRLRLILARMP